MNTRMLVFFLRRQLSMKEFKLLDVQHKFTAVLIRSEAGLFS